MKLSRLLIQSVLVFVLVMSVLVIYVGFFVHGPMDPDRRRYILAVERVQALAKAVERYRGDCERYPSANEGLGALITNPGITSWHGPYLASPEMLLDPWRTPYRYLPSANFTPPEIVSYGADRKPGGESFGTDISSKHPSLSIPTSPFEVRMFMLDAGCWIGAWTCAVGSILVLRKIRRSQKA